MPVKKPVKKPMKKEPAKKNWENHDWSHHSKMVLKGLELERGHDLIILHDSPAKKALVSHIMEEAERQGATVHLIDTSAHSAKEVVRQAKAIFGDKDHLHRNVVSLMSRAISEGGPSTPQKKRIKILRGLTRIGSYVHHSPTNSFEVLDRMLSLDPEVSYRMGKKLGEYFIKASKIRVTCPNGTDLVMGWEPDKRLFDIPVGMVKRAAADLGNEGGQMDNPPGEACIAPIPHLIEKGQIAFDGTIGDETGIPKQPIAIPIKEGGRADFSRVEGHPEDVEKLLGELSYEVDGGRRFYRNANCLGELGIGLAERKDGEELLRGDMLEDEKAFGTMHIALGDVIEESIPPKIAASKKKADKPYKGKNSKVHIDGIITHPTLELFIDGHWKKLIDNGTFIEEILDAA